MNYAIWLTVCVGIPLIFIWIKYFQLLKNYRITLALIVVMAVIIHSLWDISAVKQGLWSFPAGKNFGIIIVNLPVEEWLYTIFVPLLGASITLVAKYLFKTK